MQDLLDAGFVIPKALDGEGIAGTSLGHDDHYDPRSDSQALGGGGGPANHWLAE